MKEFITAFYFVNEENAIVSPPSIIAANNTKCLFKNLRNFVNKVKEKNKWDFMYLRVNKKIRRISLKQTTP